MALQGLNKNLGASLCAACISTANGRLDKEKAPDFYSKSWAYNMTVDALQSESVSTKIHKRAFKTAKQSLAPLWTTPHSRE